MENTTALEQNEFEPKVAKFLIDSKFPPHYSGYIYLKELILQSITMVNQGKAPDKSIWKLVAAKFGTSASNVERCVRTVIGVWWDRFCVLDLFIEKPTCRECAMLCAEYISLGLSPDYEPPQGKGKRK